MVLIPYLVPNKPSLTTVQVDEIQKNVLVFKTSAHSTTRLTLSNQATSSRSAQTVSIRSVRQEDTNMDTQGSLDIWSNPVHLLPSSSEIIDAFLDIPVSTVAIIVGIIFWLGILWIPLKGIDRRDSAASMMYGLFMCFAATALFIVPKGTKPETTNYLGIAVTLIVIFGGTKFRWLYRSNRLKTFKEIAPEDTK